jgi:hypothetical protein
MYYNVLRTSGRTYSRMVILEIFHDCQTDTTIVLNEGNHLWELRNSVYHIIILKALNHNYEFLDLLLISTYEELIPEVMLCYFWNTLT